MKARRLKRAALREFHHNVYVILLSPAVAKHPSILKANPARDRPRSRGALSQSQERLQGGLGRKKVRDQALA
jgi:hypothetical protein